MKKVSGWAAGLRRNGGLLPVVLFMASVVYLYLIHMLITLAPQDDAYYLSMTHQYRLADFLAMRYHIWSGRMFADAAVFLSVSTGTVMYRLINPLVILLTAYSISRYFTDRVRLRAMLFALFSMGLLATHVIGSAVYWVTGSYNYNVPVAMGLFCMVPYADAFFREKQSVAPLRLALCILAAVCCALGNEQSALAALCAAAAFHIVQLCRKKKVPASLYALTAVLLAALLANVLCPGTMNRWHLELQHFPGFDQLPLSKHVQYDAGWLYEHMANHFSLLLAALAVIPVWLRKRYRGRDVWAFRVFAAQIAFVLVVKIGNLWPYFTDFSFLKSVALGEAQMTPALLLGVTAQYVFWTIFGLLLFYLVCRVAKYPIFTALCLGGGMLANVMVSFSPSMEASQNRVFYVCSVMLLVVLAEFAVSMKLTQKNGFLLAFAAIALTQTLTMALPWAALGYQRLM